MTGFTHRCRFERESGPPSALLVVALVALTVRGLMAGTIVTQNPPQPPGVDPARLRQCVFDNGLGYGPFRDGQSPDAGISPTDRQVEEDMVFMSRLTRRVRTYSSRGSMARVPALAEKLAMRATVGIALGKDVAANEAEIASALALARAGLADELIVGNEVLTGNLLPKSELVSYLRRLRRDAPAGTRITTAETWDQWEAHRDLLQDVDFVVSHFYPFWEGHSVDGAAASFVDRFETLQRSLNGVSSRGPVRIVVGETGWPSAGAPRVPATVPGPENQRKFFEEFVQAACDRSIFFYWFAAFDEEWKWQEGMSSHVEPRDFPRDRSFAEKWIGSSWGLFQSNGLIKSTFAGIFEQPDRGSRRHRDIFVNGQLAAYYDIGVDTSGLRRNWLTTPDDTLKMAYPPGQDWGAVFITVGTPVPMPRPWKDFSEFEVLSLELKGERGGEFVEIGIKRYNDPDDGSEHKETIGPLDTSFRRYDIDLRRFAHSQFVVPAGLSRLYVVTEFVFDGRTPQIVFARNVRYLSTD